MFRRSDAIVLLLMLGEATRLHAQVADSTRTATAARATVADTQAASPQEQPPSSQSAPPETPKRIFDLIPNFTTTDDHNDREPLAVRHKFALAMDQAFDISAHLGNLFQTSMQQLTNGQPHYTSWSFGSRFAASEADQVSSCLFIYGVLPAVLHDDPRYFRRQDGSAVSRTWYAVSRTFISRNDAGRAIFNTPQLAGQLAQAGLSNLYYPRVDRSLSGTLTNWAIQLGYNSAFNVLKEFYPDLLEKAHPHGFRPETKVLAGTVKKVSGSWFIVNNNSGDATFVIARTTLVIAPGAGTATRDAGGAVTFNHVVQEGDHVRVSYAETGDALMALEVRVTLKAR